MMHPYRALVLPKRCRTPSANMLIGHVRGRFNWLRLRVPIFSATCFCAFIPFSASHLHNIVVAEILDLLACKYSFWLMLYTSYKVILLMLTILTYSSFFLYERSFFSHRPVFQFVGMLLSVLSGGPPFVIL